MDKLVSVIVPVYNVDRYPRKMHQKYYAAVISKSGNHISR